MWASVNVTLDQEARESVLDESLFTWTCPSAAMSALSYPCLYHDMTNKFMIYLVRRKAGEPERRRSGNRYRRLAALPKRLAADLPMN